MHTPGGSPAVPSSLTYEPHFGLAEKPFSLAVNPKFLYKSPTHRVAFDRLLAGVRRREGLIVLTGEVGTGKTTVCRAVIDALDRRTFSAFVPDPFVTREDLLKAVLIDFGVVSADDIKAGRLQGASRQDLSHLLYEFLHAIAPLDAFAVIVVDEAQNLSLPVLEEIRILTELETGERMLQVVLVGQPELRTHLTLPEMRQMNQRVSVRAELRPLDAEGVAAYVAHRLSVAAQGAACGVTFAPDAVGAVWRASAGVPRLVNKICDGSLESAFAAGASVIEAAHVIAALAALELPMVAEPPVGYAVPVRVMGAPASRAGAAASGATASVSRAPARPGLEPPDSTEPGGDAGLDAFVSERPAPPPHAATRPAAPAPARTATARTGNGPRALPTLFSSDTPALGRTSEAREGWLTKLWRASILALALAGALATSGVLDMRSAPWQPRSTSLPTLPPEPPPVFAARPGARTTNAGRMASGTSTRRTGTTLAPVALEAGGVALRTNVDLIVTASAPDPPASGERTDGVNDAPPVDQIDQANAGSGAEVRPEMPLETPAP